MYTNRWEKTKTTVLSLWTRLKWAKQRKAVFSNKYCFCLKQVNMKWRLGYSCVKLIWWSALQRNSLEVTVDRSKHKSLHWYDKLRALQLFSNSSTERTTKYTTFRNSTLTEVTPTVGALGFCGFGFFFFQHTMLCFCVV